VPDGHYVVSAYDSVLLPGLGGLYVVDPRVPGSPQRITGLGPDLTGSFSTGNGAYSVAVRQDDGALYVGEVAGGPAQLELHVITLQGLAVVTDTKISIGNLSSQFSGGFIEDIEVLANGDLLIAANVPTQQPLNGSPLGIVSPRMGTVQPIPLFPVPPGGVLAAVVDRSETKVYFLMADGFPSVSTVYEVPISGGVPQALLQLPQSSVINSLALHKNGKLYLGMYPIQSFDPETGVLSVVGTPPPSPSSLDIERTTGSLVFPLNGFGEAGRAVCRMTLGGETVRVAELPSGLPSDIAIRHDPWTYGQDTPAQNTYRWQTEPNPGGLPRIGNAEFGLRMTATPSGNAAGALLAATAAGSTPVAGVELLVGGQIVLGGSLPASGNVPLPLPLATALVGATVYLQSFHLDSGGLAASNGLRMTVLQ
jgi:hypothetical protein